MIFKDALSKAAKFTLALSLLTSVNLMAQDDDDEPETKLGGTGWVITNKGDTIKGEILERDKKTGLRFEGDKIRLTNAANEKKTYAPGRIKAYYNGETYYESVPFKEDEFGFMELVSTGVLNLYRLDLERDKKGEIEVYDTQYYVRKSSDKKGVATRIKDNNFKKEMTTFCKDNQDIIDLINDKDYVFEDLEKLVKDYNKEAGSKTGGK